MIPDLGNLANLSHLGNLGNPYLSPGALSPGARTVSQSHIHEHALNTLALEFIFFASEAARLTYTATPHRNVSSV